MLSDRVTILIPTFNRVKLLKRAIASVTRQTYSQLNIIVCDNSSTDETELIVRDLANFDNRIIYLRHPSNIGGLENFRYAFSLVKTPFFCVLSDDDFLTKDFIFDSVKVLQENTNVGFVIQNSLWINELGELISTGGHPINNELKLYCDQNRFDVFHNLQVPYIWTGMLFRGELAHLYFFKTMNNDVGSDFRYLFRVISKYNYAYLAKIGAFFTSHASSMSSSRPYFDNIEYVKECERYIEILEDESVDELLKERVRIFFVKFVNKRPYKLALKEALRHLVKNWCSSPELPSNSILKFSNDFSRNGFLKTGYFFSTIYKFKSLGYIIKLLYGRYNNYRIKKYKYTMKSLQQTIYKPYFDDIESL
jgi:glycosyltransferase involved in cell wall biosynthesis